MPTTDTPTLILPAKQASRGHTRPKVRRRLLEEFEDSEQSVAQFCEERGLCRSTLWRWMARQRESQDGGTLVEIAIPASCPTATPVCGNASEAVSAELVNGTRLSIPVGIDPVWIGALMRELAARS